MHNSYLFLDFKMIIDTWPQRMKNVRFRNMICPDVDSLIGA